MSIPNADLPTLQRRRRRHLTWTSLPVTSASAGSVQASAKTVMSYFDPGWIRTSDDPANPKVRFDYTALGWQAEPTPERKDAPGIRHRQADDLGLLQ